MPHDLLPVRVEDWLTLGRMFDRAAANGYQSTWDFCKAMERQGVTFAVSAEALARYRRMTDSQKFASIMEDDAESGDKDHGLNIQIDQHSGEVWVREVPVEQIEEHERLAMPVLGTR